MAAVAATSMLLFLVYFKGGVSGARVCVIEVDGREFASYELSSVSGRKIVEIENDYGKNTVAIYSDGAEVIYSDCPDGREVKAGRITEAGESLICLPHRLCVRLEGKKKDDAVSW